MKLRLTANLPGERGEVIDKEFDGFQKLFANFLAADSQVNELNTLGPLQRLTQGLERCPTILGLMGSYPAGLLLIMSLQTFFLKIIKLVAPRMRFSK